VGSSIQKPIVCGSGGLWTNKIDGEGPGWVRKNYPPEISKNVNEFSRFDVLKTDFSKNK
jgi:hypothetical protein